MKIFHILLFAMITTSGCYNLEEKAQKVPKTSKNEFQGAWLWESLSYNDADTSYLWTDIEGTIAFTETGFIVNYIPKSVAPESAIKPSHNFFECLRDDELGIIMRYPIATDGAYIIKDDSLLITIISKNPRQNTVAEKRSFKIDLPTFRDDKAIWNTGKYEIVWKKVN